jgi:deoxyadenosine/deoxycytidine kinase
MHYNYIAIEGTIGAGKTSFAAMFSKEYKTRLILEQFEDNDFLPKFYKDPSKYAFPLELSFLAARFQQLRDELSVTELFRPIIVSDYFINKSLIFARKTLADDEYGLYSRLFNIINLSLPKPDLLVYLYVSVQQLKSNIIKRGRPYEQDIQHEYLEKIQSGYFDYLRQQNDMRILIIDTNKMDFVNIPEHYDALKDIVNRQYPIGVHTITP